MGLGSRGRSSSDLLPSADVRARDRAVDTFESGLAGDFDVDVTKPGVAKRGGVFLDRARPRHAAGALGERALHLRGQLCDGDHIRNREPAAWPEDAVRLAQNRALVSRAVD